MKWTSYALLAGTLATLTACSSNTTPSDNKATSTTTATASQPAADDNCKDFPIPLYPRTTSLTCSQDGDRYTASIDTNDSIDEVTQFYQTLPESSGWQKDPDPLISPEHTVVTVRKGPGHAVVSTFLGQDKKGCSFQINAFPKGNP